MRDAIFVVFISFLLVSSACASIQENRIATGSTSNALDISTQTEQIEPSIVDSNRTDIVKAINFIGNRKFTDKVLRQRLSFKLGDRLDPYLADDGRQTVIEVYRKIGYAFVEVDLDYEQLSQGRLLYLVKEGPRIKIRDVNFVGNKAMRTRTLEKLIKTKEKKWLYWPFYYTEDAVEEDLEKLRQRYYEHGYLNNSIKAKKEFTTDKSKVSVTFIIDEGPTYHVGKIIFVGNKYFDDTKLQSEVELKQGQVYLKEKADSDAERFTKIYREHGFVDAEVLQKPQFVLETDVSVVDVKFEISEGRQFRIGQIDITGNERTRDKVVRRILDEYDFTPGQLYNADMAPKEGGGKLESYVKRITLADEVIIRPVEPDSNDPNQKDVRVDITEGMTGMIMPGVGVSSDSGVIGRLVYQQRNFDITDWPDSFSELITMKAFRGAGQTMRISLEPGTEVSQYSVNFSDPYFRDRPIQLDVAGSSWGRWRESYDEQRLRGYVGLEKRRKERWRRSIGFRAENVDVQSLDSDAPQEIIDVAGNNAFFGAKLETGKTVVDNRFNPSSGYSLSASYEQLTGDHTFGILTGNYVRYTPLYEDVLKRKTVLSTKLFAATTTSDAPPFEKFYAGGTGSYGIRGFEYRGVSTRGLQTGVAIPQRIDPIGSDWIFLAKAEVTVPLIGDNFAGLLFVDSGTIDTGPYRVSIGAGIQILIPQWFGPVPMRFELATPLRKDELDEVQVFSFSVGTLY